jgi:hypothetical protein
LTSGLDIVEIHCSVLFTDLEDDQQSHIVTALSPPTPDKASARAMQRVVAFCVMIVGGEVGAAFGIVVHPEPTPLARVCTSPYDTLSSTPLPVKETVSPPLITSKGADLLAPCPTTAAAVAIRTKFSPPILNF